MANEKEKAIVAAMVPLMNEIVANRKRIIDLEDGTSKAAGDAAAADLARMADSFRKASMRVQDLPHLSMRAKLCAGFGMPLSRVLPEVFS
jgi:hypothetical protein